MENQQSAAPSIPPKRNATPMIIISLVAIATFLTGIAYLVIPQTTTKDSKQTTNTTPAHLVKTANLPKSEQWQKYENTKYDYSFFYPATWKITKADTGHKNFELHNTSESDLGIITIEFLTAEERKSMKPLFCENAKDPIRCHKYQLTQTSNAIIDRLTSENVESSVADALISHPAGGALRMIIIDDNVNSLNTLTTLIDTLSFPGERRTYGMAICPDSWPTTETYVTYNNVQIPTQDVDAEWIEDNCQYTQ